MLEAAVYTDLAPQLIASPELGRTGILLEAPVVRLLIVWGMQR
jgi:hypothetical protein